MTTGHDDEEEEEEAADWDCRPPFPGQQLGPTR